ncbi:uncharacterized protein EAF02_011307 [Botrytis sinoallii]|uniref:uncharacterized protein n=1 Tax=Botrytis sinoallii TaxID=1463999 RepID=UPI00190252BA|nr:uncharacterized protein EAF02_011307 [Botrytis sinoallii]KAF7857074.1 hypothetical protein EAF02_011307 [Botrytis sinoallii]
MPPQSHPTLQKGMRKGTRSCYECRKRKVRCIFTKESEICGNCELQGRRCTEQRRELIQAGNVDTRESLREKIKRLEAVIEYYGRKSSSTAPDEANRSLNIDLGDVRVDNLSSESTPLELGAKRTPASTPSSLETPASVDETSSQDIDPIVTLFHNAIWRSHSSDLIPERISKVDKAESPATAKKHIRTRESLHSGLIPLALREIVVNATCSWWYTWRPLGSMLQSSTGDVNSTLPDFILWALESPDPSIIGIAILCIAVCLQQLDTRIHQYIIRQLPSLPGTLFQEHFEKVERLIVNDGDYASTKEGIETVVFAAKIYSPTSQSSPSTSFHRQKSHRKKSKNTILAFIMRRRCISLTSSWTSLRCRWSHYSYNSQSRKHYRPIPPQPDNSFLKGHRSKPTRPPPLHLSIPHTQNIQTSLHTIAQTLPPSFWDPQTTLSQNKISRPEYLEQIAAQCWYYHLLVLLHMPLMLQSILDPTLETHRTQCLSAARNLLRIWHIMRSDIHSAFEMVKLIDYQAFVCSTLLILSMLGYGSCENGETDENRNENEHHDRELLARTIAMLAQAGDSLGNLVAKQAVQGLESLLQMGRGNCPRKQGRKMGEGEDLSLGNPYAKIVVPYVGVITISPGEYYENIEAAVDVVTGMQTEMHTQNQTQTQNQSAPFSFSLENNPNPSHNHDQYHEALRNGDASNHHNTNTRYEEPGTSGEAREVPEDTQGQRQIQMEWTSIDFDWASNLTAGFEDDWAWLNGLGG